jgi:hypothetical protein
MSEQVEIIKQVKLTSAQRIALIAAANSKGELQNVEYGVREQLRYLGLITQRSLYTRAEVDKDVADAWKALRAAVAARDSGKAEKAIHTIRSAGWAREKKVWSLTAAADEYLLKGRVIVTVGPKNEADTRSRLRA